MTQSPGDPETQFSELLARFDEELAATPDTSSITKRTWVSSRDDASLQRRLDRVQNCLRLLDQDRRRLSASNSNTATGAGFQSGLSIVSPDDLKGTPRQIGRFQLIRRLGSGGFGVVFLAEDPTLKRLVAVKIPRPETLATPDLQARFIRESQLAARVTHPHLVPVYEAGQAGPVSYQVTAYCAGGNLSQWLRKAEILASPDVKSRQHGVGNPAGGSASQH
ncbi:MAG: protein kinase, partial [Planctomycetaceae bacterium]|nr:protein kinase [Planctomycetaceae bacterium]